MTPESSDAVLRNSPLSVGEPAPWFTCRSGTNPKISFDTVGRRYVVLCFFALRQACMMRVHDRLAPEIHKAFQFQATRMKRYIVACCDAAGQGQFRPHRDNTTKGTAHRRFAVSLLLNSGEYEGGCLRFLEYGRQLYSTPTGGAVVFSCSMLHEATSVTRGRRYMFLPILYDDETASLRSENRKFRDDSVIAKATGEFGNQLSPTDR